MASNVTSDVERLFQCFKCGISPPQSAVKERKTIKSRINKASSSYDICASSGILSHLSEGNSQSIDKSIQLGVERINSSVVKPNHLKYGNPISPIVFYGSPHGMPPKKHPRFLRLLREIHIDLTSENKSDLRRKVWVTFPKQDEAMKFANEQPHLHIFCYQDHLNGQRRFLVSTYKEFWQRYKNMNSKYRHHYEVIQEGLPCHLYFDLEFSRRVNTVNAGEEMVNILVSVVFEVLLDIYGIHGSPDWVVELDSSTEEKFSRHLIIRIPKRAFKNNLHVGAFVAEVCSQILSTRDRNPAYDKLFISKDSSTTEFPSQLFVDTAVYSRNRCFRLALSSKAGKNTVLQPTGRFITMDMSEEDMFMKSLICNIDADCEKFLVCKMDVDCVKTLQFDTELNHKYRKHSTITQEQLSVTNDDISRTYFMGKSPFLLLDMFVEAVASIGNVSGKIRSWYWFSEYGLMVYSMLRNRYCERIGREHKSNHVMYVVDLKMGFYYQKCYDPDCRGYRSPRRPVPENVIPDNTSLSNPIDSVQKEFYGVSTIDDHNPGLKFVENEEGKELIKDVCCNEALEVADNIEHMQISPGNMELEKSDDEDEKWWMAVEKTAYEIELSHTQQL